MEKENNYYIKIIGVFLIMIFALLIIRIFNIYYPIKVDLTSSERSSEFSVTGEGKIEVVPDIAYLSTGITVENEKSVKDVTQKISTINNAIINSVKSLGILKEDIKTSQYSINPEYEYPEDNARKISGYTGSVNISVKIRDLSKISEVILKTTEAGANEISGVRFDIDNPNEFRAKARDKAIENAKTQAKELSRNLGIKLGKITNIIESSSNEIPRFAYKGLAVEDVSQGAGVIEPGSQTVTSTVTLYFEKK